MHGGFFLTFRRCFLFLEGYFQRVFLIFIFRMCIEDPFNFQNVFSFFRRFFSEGVFLFLFLGCAWRTRSERGWPPKAQSQARP